MKIKPVPIPVGAHHPNVPHNPILPQHEFTLGLIAPKGSGKTTLIANLLRFYKGYFHTIVVFSPTLHAVSKKFIYDGGFYGHSFVWGSPIRG